MSGSETLTDSVVICTRNRAKDLERALRSLRSQTRKPHTLIIVDSSDGDDSEALVSAWSRSAPPPFSVDYVRTPPGLPLQRNVALRRTTADVVHFLDDDVELDDEYVESIMDVFQKDSRGYVVGVGGLIENQAANEPRLCWRIARFDSRRRGRVLLSGANTIVNEASRQMDVDWLSGCSMSYRRRGIGEELFDEALPGYALMEDVDFSFRMGRKGRLVLEPRARLVHHVSPENRWDSAKRYRTVMSRRGWFVRKNLPTYALGVYWWSVLAGCTAQICASMAKRQLFGLRVAGWYLLGSMDFLRGRI